MNPREQARAVQLLSRWRQWANLLQWGADVTRLPPTPGMLADTIDFLEPRAEPAERDLCVCPFPRENCPATCRRGCAACLGARS